MADALIQYPHRAVDVFVAGGRESKLGISFTEAQKKETRVRDLLVEQSMEEIGGVVWDCSRLTCAVLPEVRGKRVLELGCGAGVVGMACARAGATVLCTDGSQKMVDLALRNATKNNVDLDVALLRWGDAVQESFDVVFASDCCYDHAALPALLETLRAVTRPHTVVYLTYKRRHDHYEATFFTDLESHFHTVHFSHPDSLPDPWRASGFYLCRIANPR